MISIRHGYEISVACTQPTPMICMMAVQPGSGAFFPQPETFATHPFVPTRTYYDLFGNVCRRLIAPPGILTLTSDAVIQNDGLLDPVATFAGQALVQDLPDDCMVYLMGSRYCETDRLSQTAWDMFGHTPPGWARVQAICDYAHGRIGFDYNCARSTRTAFEAFEEQTGVCRDFAHLALTLCRCMNIPRLDRGLPRRGLVHFRPAQQRTPHRADRHRPRPRRRRRAAHQLVRAAHPRVVQGLGGPGLIPPHAAAALVLRADVALS
jgi:transglutaminase-like putative cysteine protease